MINSRNKALQSKRDEKKTLDDIIDTNQDKYNLRSKIFTAFFSLILVKNLLLFLYAYADMQTNSLIVTAC